MNILLVSPYFSPMIGGVETHLDDLCQYLNKQGYKVFVRTYKALGTNIRGRSSEKKGSVDIHRLWWPDFNLIFKLEKYPFLKFTYLFLGLFIDTLLFLSKRNIPIDVIQAHGFIAAFIGVILGKLFNKRIIVNTHVGFRLSRGIMSKLIKWTLLNCDKVLVLTTGAKKSLVSLGIPENKIEIYHYWVDQKVFRRQKEAKKKLGWENKFIVLFVGRLIEVKGVRVIFKLAEKFKKIIFIITGSGPLSEELQDKSQNYTNIIFLGSVSNKSLPIYYSGADLLIIPSKIIKQEYEEGIPRVMIEALSCGLPVISTKSGGISEMLNEKTGRLADNIDEMNKIIDSLYKHRTLLRLIPKNCRKYALAVFSIKNASIIENSLISKC